MRRTCGRCGRRCNPPLTPPVLLCPVPKVCVRSPPSLTLIGPGRLPIAALASRGAFLYEAAPSNAKLVSTLAMNVAVTLLTPSLVAAGLFLARG